MIARLIIVALALGSLSSVLAEKELRPLESANKGDSFCQGCRSLVSFATFYNSTENRTQFKDITEEFCLLQTAGQDEAYCTWFTEFIFEILNRMDPVRYCDKLGVCSPTGSASPTSHCTGSCRRNNNEIPTSTHLGDGVVCEVCEQAITQLKMALTDPTIDNMIKQSAEQFCNYLTIIGEDKMCRQLIDNYLKQALDFMRTVQPSVYCKSIALCSGNNIKYADKVSIPPSLLASFKGFGIENKVFINDKLVKDIASIQTDSPKPQVMKGPNCMLCKTLVKEMFKFLKDNRTEENVRENLDKVCSLVFSRSPNMLKNCEEIVSTYSKQIIEMLIDETDPDLICTLLDQCTYHVAPKRSQTEESSDNIGQLLSMLDSSIEPESKRVCLECKLFIEYIQVAIADAKTEAEVRDWLAENLCNNLQSKSIRNTCTNFIDTYSGVLFKAIIKELDPKSACVELRACNRSRLQTFVVDAKPKQTVNKLLVALRSGQEKIAVVKQPFTRATFCDQCVDFVTEIDEYLSSHPLDHDVSVLIDQVCNKIPNESAKNQCVFFIKTFGQEIAQAISTMDNPRQLCSKLIPGLC